MKKSTIFRIFVLLVLALTLAACAKPPTTTVGDDGLIAIDFRLNWTLYGEHAPFFLGVEKGFYLEEGLDVTILEGSGSATVAKLIGNGTNLIGYVDSATMMRSVVAGVPIKAVAVMFQSAPMAFIQRADSPRIIDSVDKIPGSKLAITAGDASLAILDACLGKNNISKDEISLIQVSNPAAKETSVLEGQSDAFMGYFVDQPMRMAKNTGIPMVWNLFVDVCDVNTLSSAIVVNNFWAAQNPEIVEKFVRASQRAWAYTAENQMEAAEIFAVKAEAFGFDVPLSLAEIEGSLTLQHTPRTVGKPLGFSDIADWEDTQNLLAEFAGLRPEPDLNVYFTNQFIAEPPYLPPGK
jgi:NitT/TauT family transport system substrate-binding protein